MSQPKNKRSLGSHTLLYPQPALLVGTYDANGTPNLMMAAWGGICSSNPASVMVGIRKERWTYDALLEKKAFTVGIASEKMLAAADFTGIASGRNVNKFEQAGLTPVRGEMVDAPYADECPVILECKLLQHVDA
ncbi:flavin reductase family protein, partial [Desulfovibrio sp. OttesenSCG-928-C06]|nr:flavin reductase family protein [Desulfovibrio sp. OttesenSCG-928-C06]